MAKHLDKHSPKMIELKNAEFEKWRKRHPSSDYKDYFAAATKQKLASGKPHATLGGNLLTGEFREAGLKTFRAMVDYGLTEDDVCVDYGCGTLRVGVHVIEYLRPGGYWGLDIADFLLEEGRKLIGEELWHEKKPHLRVINEQSLVEAAAAKPTFLFSVAVLIHVHPDELGEYAGNLLRLIGSQGRAIIIGRWNVGDTVQSSGQSWAHGKDQLIRVFNDRGAKVEMLTEEPAPGLEMFGDQLKRCVLRISASK